LLPDDVRDEADRFAADYHALRVKEGWVGDHGREDPSTGNPALWRGRATAVREVAKIVRSRLGASPLVLDVGSGGGWAAGMLGGAEVIAIDLLDAGAKDGLSVRGDMRRLPVRNGAVDSVLYAASLHYATVDDAAGEAGRVLRPGGLLIAVDSPIYQRPGDEARALERSRAYYAAAGHPALADHYFPIAVSRLRSALISAGFRLERLEIRPRWMRAIRPGPASLVLASRLR
jgi:SAM-dependent methyltransferase